MATVESKLVPLPVRIKQGCPSKLLSEVSASEAFRTSRLLRSSVGHVRDLWFDWSCFLPHLAKYVACAACFEFVPEKRLGASVAGSGTQSRVVGNQ